MTNNGKKHMCELAGKPELFEELKAAARNARYICTGCGRVAADKARLCCPAKDLNDGQKPSKKDCCC